LSSLASQCQDISKIGTELQSCADKSKKMITQLKSNSESRVDSHANFVNEMPKIDDLHSTYQCIYDRNCLKIKNEKYGDNTYYGFMFGGGDDPSRRLKIIFTFLSMSAKKNGYVFGGFIRDIIVPRMIYKTPENLLEFKDIDIWFKNKSDLDNFIEDINKNTNGVWSLKENPIESYTNKLRNNYNEIYDAMYRCQYTLYFCGMDIALVDFVVSDQIPVNDFNVNLLIMKPRDNDFGKIAVNWFEVGCNKSGDHCKYSVISLINNIGNKCVELLDTYNKMRHDKIKWEPPMNDFHSIVKSRIKRMKDWKWKILNE
jgi:hypothetical protein